MISQKEEVGAMPLDTFSEGKRRMGFKFMNVICRGYEKRSPSPLTDMQEGEAAAREMYVKLYKALPSR